ncbi:MAG: hypothetical protein R6X10_12025 [Desulfobacterales bacterium]
MKKILLLVIIPVFMVVLIQCITAPQKWRAEDRMFAFQQRIGNGLASGELTAIEAQNLLAKLEITRRDYTVLRERMAMQEEWEPFLRRLDDLEREAGRVSVQPSRVDGQRVEEQKVDGQRVDEKRIEDRMIALQKKLDEVITAGILTGDQGREYQLKLDVIRKVVLQRVKDRPITQAEKTEISSYLDSLEKDISTAL